MTFNIHQMDNVDSHSEESEEELEVYLDALLEQFSDSPEGKECQQTGSDISFWPAELVYFGFSYVGVTLPCMEAVDVEEILTDLFPRKIILSTPGKENNAIPELIAFWHFLKREFQLKNSDRILEYLSEVRAEFENIMQDRSRFGPSKSFMLAGKEAGFDMTKESDVNKFAVLYNASISSPGQKNSSGHIDSPTKPKTKKGNNKKKLRKKANASRKKNRKRK